MMESHVAARCQQCRVCLQIQPEDSGLGREDALGQSSKLDESFMILEATMGRDRAIQCHSARGVEESFVLLPQADKHSASGSLDGTHAQRPWLAEGLEERISAAGRVFELASTESGVDQPLCPDCAIEVQRELEEQLQEAQRELAAYEALAKKLKADAAAKPALNEEQYKLELKKAEEAEKAEQANLALLEQQLAAAEGELAAAQAASRYLDDAEEQYWQAANALFLSTRIQMDERDELVHRVETAERLLTTLQRTNIYSDVFHIWFDGPFGTISGLRLGRTPEHNVEWDEINAAWGQAVLLLDSLARALSVTFQHYKLQPLGSYSRILDDNGNVNELAGPVSKLMCPGYDRAQVGFLACLKQFAGELAARGATDGGRPFELKYPIEGDRVKGQGVRYALSRDRVWTKALKYMLTNLKYCLKAACEVMNKAPGELVETLPREGPVRQLH